MKFAWLGNIIMAVYNHAAIPGHTIPGKLARPDQKMQRKIFVVLTREKSMKLRI